jgi:hypothetical protein
LRLNSLRGAAEFTIDPTMVSECLNLDRSADRVFRLAWREGLSSIQREQRTGALCGVIGQIAEALAEMLLFDLDYCPAYDLSRPGVHGVDLLLLSPDTESVVAVEVKGTLRKGSWPRLSRSASIQMSPDWLNKADNPGMAEWDLACSDVYGAIVLVNFADMVYRVGFTSLAGSRGQRRRVPTNAGTPGAQGPWQFDVTREKVGCRAIVGGDEVAGPGRQEGRAPCICDLSHVHRPTGAVTDG